MFLSMLVYSWVFGWPYAVGFVLMYIGLVGFLALMTFELHQQLGWGQAPKRGEARGE